MLFTAGRVDEWFANFRRFEANCPDALGLAVQALEVLQHQGDFARLEHYLDGLRRERYRAGDEIELCDNLEQLLYLLLFFDVEPGLVFRFAQTYDATAQRDARRAAAAAGDAPAGADPRRLPVGRPAQPRDGQDGLAGAPSITTASRFALHFYSLSRERDEWTERFAQIAERFDVVATLTEREAAMRIAADDLDILVDLSTHTNGAKPGILALKPARVQLTHVASAGTVGLSAIDFKLTDRYADVAGEPGASRSRRCCRWHGCVYPFRRVAPAVDAPVPPRCPRHRRRCGADRRIRHAAEAVAALSRALARGARAHAARAARVLADAGRVSRVVHAPHRCRRHRARTGCCSCRRDATTPRTRRATN